MAKRTTTAITIIPVFFMFFCFLIGLGLFDDKLN